MDIADGHLYLEVIGGGAKGETTILRLPSGHWGVVDCYSNDLSSITKHPIVSRLKELNVTQLEFVALTHPHDDHYRGMSSLLREFPPKRFWQFAGTTPHFLEFLLQYIPAEANAQIPLTDKSSTEDLLSTFSWLSARCKAKSIQRTIVSGTSNLISTLVSVNGIDVPLTVKSFAPDGTIVGNYETKLTKCFDSDRVIDRLTEVPLDHNVLSIGLVIEFGESRVILGADVVKATWKRVLAGDELNSQSLSATAVKVSHHGSTTGYCQNLWSRFAENGKPTAVITPYHAKLPEEVALKHISEHATPVIVTGMSPASETGFQGADLNNVFPTETLEHLRVDADVATARSLKVGRCALLIDHIGNVCQIEFYGATSQFEFPTPFETDSAK